MLEHFFNVLYGLWCIGIQYLYYLPIIYLCLTSSAQSIISYSVVYWGHAYDSHVCFWNITLKSVIKFIFTIHRFTNNKYIYFVINLSSIKNVFFLNIILDILDSYYNRQKHTISHRHYGLKSYINKAI